MPASFPLPTSAAALGTLLTCRARTAVGSLLAAIIVASVASTRPATAQVIPGAERPPTPDSAVFGLPLVDDLAIDGSLEEWDEVEVVRLVHGAEGVEGRGEPGPDDLAVEVRVAWNARGVFVAAHWKDDVLDTEVLRREDGVWTDPGGGRGDRMYFYDDLAVRLVWDDFSFGAWLAPRADAPAQWAVVNYGRGTEGSYLEDVSVTESAAAEDDDGSILLEARFGWEDLKRPPPFFDDVELRLVAADADAPGAPMAEKAEDVAYLIWRMPVALMPRR